MPTSTTTPTTTLANTSISTTTPAPISSTTTTAFATTSTTSAPTTSTTTTPSTTTTAFATTPTTPAPTTSTTTTLQILNNQVEMLQILRYVASALKSIQKDFQPQTTTTQIPTTTAITTTTPIPEIFFQEDDFADFPSLPTFPNDEIAGVTNEIRPTSTTSTTSIPFGEKVSTWATTNRDILMATVIPSLIVVVMLLVAILGYFCGVDRNPIDAEDVQEVNFNINI